MRPQLRPSAAVALLLLGTAGACVPAPRTVAPRPADIAATADSVLSTPPLDRTHWGIQVIDPASGRTLYSHQPHRHFVPASNTKLIVTSTAMALLGPDWRYTTELLALPAAPDTSAAPAVQPVGAAPAAPPDTTAAAVIVVASGDPTLSARFHPDDFAALDSLADSLAVAGIARITGPLIIDASRFDSLFINPSWEVGDLDWSYATPVAAFAIAEGTFGLVIAPGPAPGEPARVELLAPAGAMYVENRILTDTATGPEARGRVRIVRRPGSDSLALIGHIPPAATPDTFRFAVGNPAAFAARVFAGRLAERGIEVEGGVHVVFDSLASAALLGPGTPRRVATWTSPPMADIVAAILKPSQNWIAEMVLKTLGTVHGDGGSWDAGLDVERRFLIETAGIDSTAFSLVDASGLSAQNLLAPEAITRLLAYNRAQPWGETYRAALAIPGEEGTLVNRLRALEGRLFAKTGTIANVNSLSGYVVDTAGRELIFSILTNASGLRSGLVRSGIDRITTAIAGPAGTGGQP